MKLYYPKHLKVLLLILVQQLKVYLVIIEMIPKQALDDHFLTWAEF